MGGPALAGPPFLLGVFEFFVFVCGVWMVGSVVCGGWDVVFRR